MQRRQFFPTSLATLATLAVGGTSLAGCTTTPETLNPAPTDSAKRQSIDGQVQATLTRLYQTVAGARELVAKAEGVLVFPSVLQVGLIVGGQYGEGSLSVGGQVKGYFSTVSASFGFQAGAQSKAMIYLFMTRDALNAFQNSNGWSAGGSGSVALVRMGENGAVDTTTIAAPVEVFILTNSGLMGDLSIEGTKVNRLLI